MGAAARAARAAALDTWLIELFSTHARPGAALVALGGLGRRECAPYADVDLILVHDGHLEVADLAQAIWYPMWDAGWRLDHSVRTVPEALAVAHDDVRVALGLLDARYLAGDRKLAAALRAGAFDLWWRTAARTLPALRELTAARWAAHGELAFLLEGDLKQARGGLRDLAVLRAIGAAGVADAARPVVRAAATRLLDVRDALHVSAKRGLDRLLAQDRAAVAALVHEPDGDALLRRVAQDARCVAYAVDDAWRAVARWQSSRFGRAGAGAVRRPIGRDVVEQDAEAVLARRAVGPRPEPGLALRVAAAAASVRLPIARPTLEWLARFASPLPQPWPPDARRAFLTLLGSGAGLVPTWEACDRYGLVDTWLPEWHRVRSLPQHNPVHRYTVDRHLVQTAAEAARYVRQVDRPDLLVLGALLHDIGKGFSGGDHAAAGVPVAGAIAARIGFEAADVARVQRLVALHLLLPETATRRDLADPRTVARVAEAIGDVSTLDLLYAIARADAAATGPGAWSNWKGRLVAELVELVRAKLTGEGRIGAQVGDSDAWPRRAGLLPRGGLGRLADPTLSGCALPVVYVHNDLVSVAAAQRAGLLAAVAGCLALHRLDVVAADVTTLDDRSVVRCAVQPRYGTPPASADLVADLTRAVRGELTGLHRLALQRPAPDVPPARLLWHRGEASDATVLEVRAADAPGLLYRLASALEAAGAQVRSARIDTLGGAVVDAFYLVGAWTDEAARTNVESAVRAAIAGEAPGR